MKCHEFQDLIEAYLQETIEEPRREQFEEHFFQCRKCFLGLKINETLQNKDVRIPLEEKPRLFAFKVLRPMLVMSSLFLLILFSALLLRHDRQARTGCEELAAIRAAPVPPGRNAGRPGKRRGAGSTNFPGPCALSRPGSSAPPWTSSNSRLRRRRLSQGRFLPRHLLLGQRRGGQGRRDPRCHHPGHGPGLFRRSALLQGFRPAAPGQAARSARAQFEKLAAMLSPMAGKARAMVQKIDEL